MNDKRPMTKAEMNERQATQHAAALQALEDLTALRCFTQSMAQVATDSPIAEFYRVIALQLAAVIASEHSAIEQGEPIGDVMSRLGAMMARIIDAVGVEVFTRDDVAEGGDVSGEDLIGG